MAPSPEIPRAQITIGIICWQVRFGLFLNLTHPGSLSAMGGYQYPIASQWIVSTVRQIVGRHNS